MFGYAVEYAHGSPVNISGQYFHQVPYSLNDETEQIDYDELYRIAQECKPKMIVGGGIINGSVALVFDDEVERYRKAGCDFSACVTDEDYLAAIEAFEDDPPMADAGVSDQTRIADALEDMVALSLPDDTTNTTEE